MEEYGSANVRYDEFTASYLMPHASSASKTDPDRHVAYKLGAAWRVAMNDPPYRFQICH